MVNTEQPTKEAFRFSVPECFSSEGVQCGVACLHRSLLAEQQLPSSSRQTRFSVRDLIGHAGFSA